MKRVLLITYYWPPAGGSGVQRPLKFAKYLREYGWEPVIYTVENGEYPEYDEKLSNDVPEGLEVIKTKALEPYHLYRFFAGNKKIKNDPTFFGSKNKNSLKGKIAVWIRSNLFIPDPKMLWIRPSINILSDYLSKHPVDAVLSTGPPHSLHLIALGLKKKFPGLKWIADFRDPWSRIDYFPELLLTDYARKKHLKLEQKVLKTADTVVTVTPQWAREFEQIGGRKVECITNGFDTADYTAAITPPSTGKFIIRHIGMIGKTRNHLSFWAALKELTQENPEFAADLKIEFYGITDPCIAESAGEYQLSEYISYHGYVSHNQVAALQQSAIVLYLPINNTINSFGFLPGKIFEYLAVRRPVLCVGPVGGDSDKILKETQAGKTAGFEDTEGVKKILSNYYTQFKSNSLILNSADIEKYSRKSLTGKLSEILTGTF